MGDYLLFHYVTNSMKANKFVISFAKWFMVDINVVHIFGLMKISLSI